LRRNGVALSFCGDLATLPADLQRLTRDLAARPPPTPQRLHLVVALSYGGRQELARAARSLAERAVAGELRAADIDPAMLDATLREQGGPGAPDLLLRTGGRDRLSNFLLFESAYAELVMRPELWPDFDAESLASALTEYGRRTRTLGQRA
jgi:undecaprenyl diphosphate synthase